MLRYVSNGSNRDQKWSQWVGQRGIVRCKAQTGGGEMCNDLAWNLTWNNVYHEWAAKSADGQHREGKFIGLWRQGCETVTQFSARLRLRQTSPELLLSVAVMTTEEQSRVKPTDDTVCLFCSCIPIQYHRILCILCYLRQSCYTTAQVTTTLHLHHPNHLAVKLSAPTGSQDTYHCPN